MGLCTRQSDSVAKMTNQFNLCPNFIQQENPAHKQLGRNICIPLPKITDIPKNWWSGGASPGTMGGSAGRDDQRWNWSTRA
jgi:hypothetical protein